MKFEAIIFDFDGVIVDSEAVANAAMAEVLTARGHRLTGEEAVARYAGLRWIDCHRRIEEESGLSFDPEELGRAIDDAVASRTAEMLAIEGIGRFLEAQSHRILAIASSSETAWLEATLARLGLPVLSMGMSDDFETAVRYGATHVRVGTALFGTRIAPPPRTTAA